MGRVVNLVKKVMLVNRWHSGNRSFRVACACYDPGCDLCIDTEYDRGTGSVWLVFDKRVSFMNRFTDTKTFLHVLEDLFMRIRYLEERDFETPLVTLQTLVKFADEVLIGYTHWIEHYLNILYRVKKAGTLLLTGFLEMNTDFIITDPEHLRGFIGVLEECLEEMESVHDDIFAKHYRGERPTV